MTRFVAHITIKAKTPLKVGSNKSDILQDSPIQKDWNGLPMILGTSIAGVLRKEFEENFANEIFGDENGSKVIISNALLLDEKKEVNEDLLLEKSDFLKLFDNLPIREHTAINNKGVAKEHSKFDEEVVYKGTQFKFSIEYIEDSKQVFENILDTLYQNHFRIGGGSTKGFGLVEIIDIKWDRFDQNNYSQYSSSLNYHLSKNYIKEKISSRNYTTYILTLKPDDFFIFGSGFGDDEADATSVYEKVINYDKKDLTNEMILIPASSIKGAISHRTTYNYNLQNKLFIGNDEAKNIIKEIFGEAKDSKDNTKKGSKGKIIFSDCYLQKQDTKVFDHVAIDRFTGGAIDGALFQEKTVASNDSFNLEILLDKSIKDKELEAFEKTLKDISSGMLGLGGMTTKGHGFFSGDVFKDGEKL
jgi:CRISPR/Cas system CMR subunit Cmr4 (Cas7 group RAMP superfamily)